jgi:hypothetical protein
MILFPNIASVGVRGDVLYKLYSERFCFYSHGNRIILIPIYKIINFLVIDSFRCHINMDTSSIYTIVLRKH